MIQTIFSEKDNAGIVFYDLKPCKRIVKYSRDPFDSTDPTPSGSYFISVPRVLFSFCYSVTPFGKFVATYPRVFFLKSDPTGYLGYFRLYQASFSNLYENGRICMTLSSDKEHSSLDELCKSAIDEFWNSQFNGGLRDTRNNYLRSNNILGDFKAWQEQTKSNPNWIPDQFIEFGEVNLEKIDIARFPFYRIKELSASQIAEAICFANSRS